MELEFKKAVDLYENDKLNDAKKICLKIYKKNPNHFDNLRLLNFIHFKKNLLLSFHEWQHLLL